MRAVQPYDALCIGPRRGGRGGMCADHRARTGSTGPASSLCFPANQRFLWRRAQRLIGLSSPTTRSADLSFARSRRGLQRCALHSCLCGGWWSECRPVCPAACLPITLTVCASSSLPPLSVSFLACVLHVDHQPIVAGRLGDWPNIDCRAQFIAPAAPLVPLPSSSSSLDPGIAVN
jgi:hypothetical protein